MIWTLVMMTICFITAAGLVVSQLQRSEPSPEFVQAITELDTPEKLQSYMEEHFILDRSHIESPAYSPEEFFYEKRGDVRDFCVFSSYVLEQHGYEAKILWFIYTSDGFGKDWDSVTLFNDKDGSLRYMKLWEYDEDTTTFRIFEVESLEDLLAQVEKLINCRIIEHGLLPAGSTSFTGVSFRSY